MNLFVLKYIFNKTKQLLGLYVLIQNVLSSSIQTKSINLLALLIE